MDPVFCLEELERYEPQAEFVMTLHSGSEAKPFMRVEATMRKTSNPVSKGYGRWVSYDDVLRLMIRLKESK